MAQQLLRRLRDERGGSLVETLLALMLVALVVDVGVEGFAFAQARSVAIAAAQDGARAAASNDDTAGLTRAQQVLDAGGGVARALTPSVEENGGTVTMTVHGNAPQLFPVTFLIPTISTSATVPLEQYQPDEQAAVP